MQIRYTTGPDGNAPATLTLNELALSKGQWANCAPEDARRAAPFERDYGIEIRETPVAEPNPAAQGA